MLDLLRAAAVGLALALVAFASAAQPQQPPQQPQFREVRVPESVFSRGDPVPAWADLLPIPPEQRGRPVMVRLADNQYLAGDAPAVFVNRAVQVNDAAALGYVGQFHLNFVPEYQRLRLHAVRLLPG